MPIETRLRVADVLDEREIAVSGPGVSELTEGTVLRVLAAPHEIRDPETREKLGEIIRTKAVVRVYEVQAQFVLARTFRTRRVNIGGTGSSISGLFSPPKYENRVETLRLDESATRTPLPPEESAVAAGDPVEVFDGDVNDVPSSTVWK